MTKTKAPQRQGNTPVGTAKFPHLNTPDTKFNEGGTYHTKLILSAEDAAPLIEQLEALYKENITYQCAEETKKPNRIKKADKSWKEEVDEDTDEPTGNWLFTFKMNASFMKNGQRVEMRPKLFDAAGNPTKVEVGGGSQLVINYKAVGWYTGLLGAGITCYLNAVQIRELSSYGGSTAEGFGFEVSESQENDGFEAMPTDDADATPTDDEGGDF